MRWSASVVPLATEASLSNSIACVLLASWPKVIRTGRCSTNDYAGGPAREDYILSRAVSAIARYVAMYLNGASAAAAV